MRNWLRKLREDERGLTLVELLAVVVILAIVGAIAFVSVGNIIENSKKDAHVANALQVISAAKLYEAGGGDISDLSIVEATGEGENVTYKYNIDTVEALIDPWTKEEYKTLAGAKIDKSEVGVYSIKDFNASGDCKIGEATEEDLRKDGRKACD